jgi:hypothetical protein
MQLKGASGFSLGIVGSEAPLAVSAGEEGDNDWQARRATNVGNSFIAATLS